MAPEKSLEDPKIIRNGDLDPKISPLALKMVAARGKCPSSQPLHPLSHALQIFTDAPWEGWGAYLVDLHKKDVVLARKASYT